jgi:hypothetical protein
MPHWGEVNLTYYNSGCIVTRKLVEDGEKNGGVFSTV